MKVAILGCENSHAWTFAEHIKTNEKYKDIELLGIFGYDDNGAKVITEKGHCDYVTNDPHEFLGKVDAIICTARHGDNHYECAMPYIKAGIPCFIDKPFTVDLKKGEEMIAEAKKSGALLCGGSSLKFLPGLKEINNFIKEKGGVAAGNLSAPVNMFNEHGGFFFYSQHLVEMMLVAFGEDIKSVYARADEDKQKVTFIANYDGFDVTGHFYNCYHYTCDLVARDGTMHTEIIAGRDGMDNLFLEEFDEFVNMVKNKEMKMSYERLLLPVKILNAIYESYTTGKEVEIK